MGTSSAMTTGSLERECPPRFEFCAIGYNSLREW
jgi:hypothetical protein